MFSRFQVDFKVDFKKFLEEQRNNRAAATARYRSWDPLRNDHKSWRMGELFSDSNTLERPFIWNLRLRPKKVDLIEEFLVWWPEEEKERLPVPFQSDIGILNQFIRLGAKDATPSDVLEFARKWGVLGICRQHLVPFPHPRFETDGSQFQPCDYLEYPTGHLIEPVYRWREFSWRARAILRIASRLHQNKPGFFEDWRVLWSLKSPHTNSNDILNYERRSLGDIIHGWLVYGQVEPQFDWVTEKPTFSLSCNVIGLIGCHLMFAVSRSQGIAICTSCGFPYSPGRRKAQTRNNFCDDCKGPARSRESKAKARKGTKKM